MTLYGPVRDDLGRVDEALSSLSPADFPVLAAAMDQVLNAGGKRVRPALALLGGRLGSYDLGSRRLAVAIRTHVLVQFTPRHPHERPSEKANHINIAGPRDQFGSVGKHVLTDHDRGRVIDLGVGFGLPTTGRRGVDHVVVHCDGL